MSRDIPERSAARAWLLRNGQSVLVPQIWNVQLLVETDDESEVGRIADAVGKVACPEEPASDHVCRIPWFLITTLLDEDDANRWREDLNR